MESLDHTEILTEPEWYLANHNKKLDFLANHKFVRLESGP